MPLTISNFKETTTLTLSQNFNEHRRNRFCVQAIMSSPLNDFCNTNSMAHVAHHSTPGGDAFVDDFAVSPSSTQKTKSKRMRHSRISSRKGYRLEYRPGPMPSKLQKSMPAKLCNRLRGSVASAVSKSCKSVSPHLSLKSPRSTMCKSESLRVREFDPSLSACEIV